MRLNEVPKEWSLSTFCKYATEVFQVPGSLLMCERRLDASGTPVSRGVLGFGGRQSWAALFPYCFVTLGSIL